jgi:DNA-directed RNA polymerase specialized sigma24 family protein
MAKRGPKPKKTEYYVDPEEFKQRLVVYYKSNEITDDLAICINKIATGLSYSSNFINYTYRDEMVGDAIVKMYAAIKNKKFDIKSDFNPFSYFTTIAFNAFINRIKKEKKHHDTITEYRERMYEQELTENCDVDLYVKPIGEDYDGESSE